MNDFQKNNCRLCSKTFCCESCRYQHEEKVHKINPDCEICIYGRITIKQASVSLLNHIKSTHWPLHCVFCKKIFNTLDELVPHNKCTLRMEMMKTQSTPKTPVTDREEPSPEVTPFYKTLKPCQQLPSAMTATSTPLVPNCIQKSNLKLTGSSNLSDSKKSERRVTFSETPSVNDVCKKSKILPLNEHDEYDDDSYVSIEEEQIFKKIPTFPQCEEKENSVNNLSIFSDKCELNGTLWESALTKLDLSTENNPPSLCANTNCLNVSVQINVFNGNNSASTDDINNTSTHNKSKNLWSSMTNMVKSVVQNLSVTAQNSFSSASVKRSSPDYDTTELPSVKRMKLTDLKCRRPIREISPLYQIRLAKPRCVDKWTQTDDSWFN